jgi:hypothetical protein
MLGEPLIAACRITVQAKHLMITSLLLTVFVYWTGLDGPFLLDDLTNLRPVQQWAHGRLAWQEAVFGNYSGALGRPVSMASFLLTSGPLGNDPFTFKLGNLVTHLACGWLGWQVLRRVLALDPRLAAQADMLAAVMASVWLLHPLQASTVLYAVQRMAQLSALFTLASILVYLDARQRLASDDGKGVVRKLFFWFPLLFAAGLLSKENAAVTPGLCAVLELAYYRRNAVSKRILSLFYGLFLALPAAVVVTVFVLSPERPLGGYAVLDFGPFQRLLSQARVLTDYIGQLVLPRSDEMGLYTDDFRASTGLFSPYSTAICVAFLAIVSVVAIALRKRWPSVFAGWFFFLVAHSVESSILPLELYYEHRNYLPSIGLGLTAIGAVAAVLQSDRIANRVAIVAAVVALGGLSWLTLQRALIWRDKDAIVDLALIHHPESLRARQAKAMRELNARAFGHSMAVLRPIAEGDRPRERLQARIDLASVRCFADLGVSADYLDGVMADARAKITVGEVQAFDVLVQANRNRRCGALTDSAIILAMQQQLQAAGAQPESALPKQQFRILTAVVAARANRWSIAAEQTEIAWRSNASADAGLLLARARLGLGDLSGAKSALSSTERLIDPSHRSQRRQADAIRGLIETGEAAPATAGD